MIILSPYLILLESVNYQKPFTIHFDILYGMSVHLGSSVHGKKWQSEAIERLTWLKAGESVAWRIKQQVRDYNEIQIHDMLTLNCEI
jgi:hypothetical protein